MNKEQLRTEWQDRVMQYKESGLSMNKWCEVHDFKIHQLQYWIKRFKNNDLQMKENKWLPIQLDSPIPASIQNDSIKLKVGKCEVNINSGFDTKSLKEILSVLIDLC